MTEETISLAIRIFALVAGVFYIGLAVCPKEIPRIGLVVWVKEAHRRSRILLALSGIFLVCIGLGWFP